MPIRIEAAQRLRAAYADEAKARTYIDSVAGITVGKYESRLQGMIGFVLNRGDVATVVKSLNTRFGTYTLGESSSVTHEWDLDQERLIQILSIQGKNYIVLKDNKARSM